MTNDLTKSDLAASSPAPDERGSFRADTTLRTPARALREYWLRIRSGDPGALPSVLGLLILGIVFWQLKDLFLTTANIGNLPEQAAFIAIIALGLVFVLLLGEIDLAAGMTGAICAAFASRSILTGGLKASAPGYLFWAIIIAMLAAIAIGVIHHMIVAPSIIAIGLIFIVTGLDEREVTAILLAISIGTAIGTLIGTLVAKIGIPSFIATLALFLAWQGVHTLALNNEPVIVSRYHFWYGLAHNNMTPFWGWALFVLLAAGYLAVVLVRAIRRRAAGLSADNVALVLLRFAAIAAVGAVVVAFMNVNRNPIKGGPAIRGVPWALTIPVVLMIFLTIVLTKTTWGRHLYAVGGNQESARRAGIKVDKIKIGAFAAASGLAALGGVFESSYTGGVQLDLGRTTELLFAVAAAVIGGTSLFGGRGKPRDALLGALVIVTIPNGIQLQPVSPSEFTLIITGFVLLLAASVDAFVRRGGFRR